MKTLLKITLGIFAVVALSLTYFSIVNTKTDAAYIPSAPHWIKITKNFSDFSTAGLSSTITLISLPAGSVVTATSMKVGTAFTGGIIASYTLSVGVASNIDLLPASSSFTTTTRPFVSNLAVGIKTATSENVGITAISTVGLLNAATAGSVDVYLLVSSLPS